jgi:hypothetical protein
MAIPVGSSDQSVAAVELRATLGMLGTAQRRKPMDLVQSADPARKGTLPHLPEDFKRRRRRATAVTEFGWALISLKIKQRSAARWFRTSERTIRRWKSGTRRTPPGVMVIVRLMMAGKVGPADVELAAGPTPARPPAPRFVAPALEPAQTTAPSIVEQIMMLTPTSCRWPIGHPRDPGFCFCNRHVAARGSYCEPHRLLAALSTHRHVPDPGARSGAGAVE